MRHKTRLKEQVDALKGAPCMDCRVSYPPFVLDFDHRPGEIKIGEINRMVIDRRAWDIIEAEIAKCDLVCSNCHRIRTHSRRVVRAINDY